MNNNNFSLTDYIVNNCDIVEVVKHFINLQKKGTNWWGLCPFHGDKNPSLSVSSSKKIFKCFVCNAKGNVISFVKQFKNIQFFDAIKEISNILNIDNPQLLNSLNKMQEKMMPAYNADKLNREAAFIYHRTLFNKEGRDCLEYLKKRGIDEQTIEKYQLGYAPNSNERKYLFSIMTNENNILGENRDKSLIFSPAKLLENGLIILDNENKYIDFFWDRLIIPIKDDKGMYVGFSGRALKKLEKMKYVNTKTTEFFKKEEILFNFCSFDKNIYNSIFVVEGFMDVFAMVNIGRENCIASMGTAFTEKQIKLIQKYTNIEQIILCFDNDKAGLEATAEIAEKFFKFGFDVYVVNPYDKKYKDIDELLKGEGKQKTFELTAKQISYIEFETKNRLENLSDDKEIVFQTNQIIKMINKFAYNELHIDKHLSYISELSKIPYENLKKLIKPNVSNNSVVKTYAVNQYDEKNYSKKFKKYDYPYENEYPKFEEMDYAYKNSRYDEIFNKYSDKNFKIKEFQLIKIIPINSVVRDLFFEWIGAINFNSDLTKKILKCVIFWVKKMKKNSLEINYQNLIETIQKKEIVDYKDRVIDYLIEAQKDFENGKISFSKSLSQGSNLVKDIFLRLTELKRKYVMSTIKDKEIIKENNKLLDNDIDSFKAEIDVILSEENN